MLSCLHWYTYYFCGETAGFFLGNYNTGLARTSPADPAWYVTAHLTDWAVALRFNFLQWDVDGLRLLEILLLLVESDGFCTSKMRDEALEQTNRQREQERSKPGSRLPLLHYVKSIAFLVLNHSLSYHQLYCAGCCITVGIAAGC